MVKNVVWSENAIADVASVLEYLKNEWNTKVAGEFLSLLQGRIQLICDYPMIELSYNVYRILITKHNVVGNSMTTQPRDSNPTKSEQTGNKKRKFEQ
jgi:plasmid stabilization system protein ParE